MAFDEQDGPVGAWIRRTEYVSCPVCGRYEASPAADAVLSADKTKELRPCPSRAETGCTGVAEVDAYFEAPPSEWTHTNLT
ncbi:hypothetical protein [Micromonospora sp. NPDC047134]|uniref:hypothetical protein n=1 Tax=Micromonospora sp. NPDC047134 TaxID=3154340 RepID=UPI0033E06A6D